MREFRAYIPSFAWASGSNYQTFHGVDAELRIPIRRFSQIDADWWEWEEYYKRGTIKLQQDMKFSDYKRGLLCVPIEVFLEALREDCKGFYEEREFALLNSAYNYVSRIANIDPQSVVLVERL